MKTIVRFDVEDIKRVLQNEASEIAPGIPGKVTFEYKWKHDEELSKIVLKSAEVEME
jgi:hypothetical protein